MRKLGMWILSLAMVWGLALCAHAQTADHPHSGGGHCVCGGAAVGVGDHTQCQREGEWTPIYGKVDFGTLASGNYYLTGDVTVTKASSIGAVQKVTDETGEYYQMTKERHIAVCLNGYDITTTTTRVFHSIMQNSSLTVCDCSYDASTGTFGGTITGGTSAYGGISYTHAKSALNIYGGNWTGKADYTNSMGGLIVVAQDSGDVPGCKSQKDQQSVCNIYNGNFYGGSSGEGGNIYVMHCSAMNLYGGTVSGGTATKTGGNIYVSNEGTLNLQGTADSPVRILNGTAASYGNIRCLKTLDLNKAEVTGGSPEVARIVREGHLVNYKEQYTTLAAAIAGAEGQSGAFVQLCADTQEDLTIDGQVLLDLAGHDLSGITITGKLYGMDSTTLGYDDSKAGTLTPASGAPQVHVKTTAEQVGGIYRYLAVEDSGSYSFHRFYIGITKISLKPSSVGMGYKATFAGDETVKNALDINQGYGYSLWLDGYSPVKRGYPAAKFGNIQEMTLRIENFLSADNTDAVNAERAEMDVHATAFVKLNDGTVITSSEVAYNFHEMIQLADDAYDTYTTSQQNALQTLGGSFSQTMLTWDVSHIHHASGSIWQHLTSDSFHTLLKNNSNTLPSGNYVLTEDIDLAGKRLTIPAGKTVSICLNGHTLSDSVRIFSVHGNFNICDCHHDGEEGTITSSFAAAEGATSGYYAPVFYAFADSVTNLYGGNLTATGQVNAAGVVAVSHDNSTHPDKPAAILNMYGGSICGGDAMYNGGLVSLWNGATFNLYDGLLTDGSAGSNGGGIFVGNKCTFNMYGGNVTGNTAQEMGGGVYVEKSGASFYGTATVTDNAPSNVHLRYGSRLCTVDLDADAQVGITSAVHALLADSATGTQGLVSDEEGYLFQVYENRLLMISQQIQPAKTLTQFSVGYGKACITPEELGLPLTGYGNDNARAHTQVLDDLYVTCIAVTDAKNNTVLLITCDLKTPQEQLYNVVKDHVAAVTGIPGENIYIAATHTHSAPSINYTTDAMTRYKSMACDRFAQAAAQAMEDRSAATMQTGSFEVEGLNFTRHYSYIDANGVLQYFGDNFGTQTLNSTTAHVTENDPTMHLLKFDRSGQDILLVNWRAHPTMTGGSTKSDLSSDFIGPFREAVEEQTGMLVAYFQGAAGNQNTFSRITAEKHNLTYTAYGQELASQLVENISCLKSVKTGDIQTDKYVYAAAVDHSADARYDDATYVANTYWGLTTSAERKALLAQYNFTSVYHASAVRAKYAMGETVDLELNVFTIGDSLAFYTAPGELWNTVAVAVEAASDYAGTFTIGYCNGDIAYIPHEKALTYDSYESLYCRVVQPTSINDMIAYWTETMEKFYNGKQNAPFGERFVCQIPICRAVIDQLCRDRRPRRSANIFDLDGRKCLKPA